MLAKCTGTSLTSLLDSNSRANFTESVHLDEVALTVGDTYVVYGVITRSGFPWFLVCEASDDEYPKPHFGGFFELLDERVPPEWSVSLSQSGSFRGLSVLPRPWAEDPYFMEKLVEGKPDAIRTFFSIKGALRSWHQMG